jgi:hypothetical protein
LRALFYFSHATIRQLNSRPSPATTPITKRAAALLLTLHSSRAISSCTPPPPPPPPPTHSSVTLLRTPNGSVPYDRHSFYFWNLWSPTHVFEFDEAAMQVAIHTLASCASTPSHSFPEKTKDVSVSCQPSTVAGLDQRFLEIHRPAHTAHADERVC